MEDQNTGNVPQDSLDKQFAQQFGAQASLPNASAVLVLGILSIVFSILFFCYLVPAVLGLIMAIIALSLSSSGMRTYNAAPHLYNVSSYNNLKAGRICAIVGLSLSALVLLICLLLIIFYFAAVGSIFGALFS